MWSDINNEGRDLRWVVQAIASGTAIWVTDGSYNRELAPSVSGAGWALYCTRCGRKLYGSFAEFSPSAGSYRAELLGLLAIHTLLAALEEFYHLPGSPGTICCDNQGALRKSETYRRRIPVGASQADIKRAFRKVKTGLKASLHYSWVQSHQDRYKLWHHLTIEQQLNCYCDSLAKEAVLRAQSQRRPGKQTLPRESAAVFIQGRKQTSDIASAARYSLGLKEAEAFYTAPVAPRDARGRRRGGVWDGGSRLSTPSRGKNSTGPSGKRASCTGNVLPNRARASAALSLWYATGTRRATTDALTAVGGRRPPT